MKLRQRIYESSMTEKEAFIACKNLIVDALNTQNKNIAFEILLELLEDYEDGFINGIDYYLNFKQEQYLKIKNK